MYAQGLEVTIMESHYIQKLTPTNAHVLRSLSSLVVIKTTMQRTQTGETPPSIPSCH